MIGVYSEGDATELPRAYVVPKDLEGAKKDPAAFERDVQAFVARHVAPHKKLRGGVRLETKIEKSPCASSAVCPSLTIDSWQALTQNLYVHVRRSS